MKSDFGVLSTSILPSTANGSSVGKPRGYRTNGGRRRAPCFEKITAANKEGEKMKNKIICLLLAIIMVFGMFALTACGGGDDPADKDDDNKKPGGGKDDSFFFYQT